MATTVFTQGNIEYGEAVTLVTQICISCGVPFAIPDQLDNQLRKTHKYFYCPNGHQQHYAGKSDAEKAREEAEKQRVQFERQLQSKDSTISYLRNAEETQRKRVISLKGQKTRIVNRIKKGICPCCNEQFADLHAHMSEKHPDTI